MICHKCTYSPRVNETKGRECRERGLSDKKVRKGKVCYDQRETYTKNNQPCSQPSVWWILSKIHLLGFRLFGDLDAARLWDWARALLAVKVFLFLNCLIKDNPHDLHSSYCNVAFTSERSRSIQAGRSMFALLIFQIHYISHVMRICRQVLLLIFTTVIYYEIYCVI